MRLETYRMFCINAAVMVPKTVSVSPIVTTGGQCFLLWEQHLVLDREGLMC